MADKQGVKWIILQRQSGKYLNKVTDHGLEWGEFQTATHFKHPYFAWGTVKAFNVNPELVDVHKVAVMYRTKGE